MSDLQSSIEFRPRGNLDISRALLPFAGPWNPRLAAHLLRRAGFGGSPAEIQTAVDQGMLRTVDRLLQVRPDSSPSSPSEDLTYGPTVDPAQRRKAYLAVASWWLDRAL